MKFLFIAAIGISAAIYYSAPQFGIAILGAWAVMLLMFGAGYVSGKNAMVDEIRRQTRETRRSQQQNTVVSSGREPKAEDYRYKPRGRVTRQRRPRPETTRRTPIIRKHN